MKKCIIIAAFAPNNIRNLLSIHEDDLILCADAGYEQALAQGLAPHAVIGDLDSLALKNIPLPDQSLLVTYPKEKDETDSFLCYQYGKEKGYSHFILLGGIGGRLDHTIGNIQMMVHALNQGEQLSVYTDENEMYAYLPGTWEIKRKKGWKLSLFSYAPLSKGIDLSGVAYPIEKGKLTWDFPLGISNEWISPAAKLSFSHGLLLVILSKEE